MIPAEYWTAAVVDRAGDVVDELPRIIDGTLELNSLAAVQGGGTIELAAPPTGIDWLTARIRITHHRGDVHTPMGVYLPSWPGAKHAAATKRHTIQLEDATAILRSQTGYWLDYGAGVVVTERLALVLSQLGEVALALTHSPETLRAGLTWDPSVTWGRVFADLTDAAGYRPVWIDQAGWWRAAPYIPPADRPLTATYGGDDTDLLMTAEWADDADLGDLPNRIFAYTQADHDSPALTADVRITDPRHPLHADRIGLRTRAERVEATSQSVLDAKARRLLAESTEVSRWVTWRHPVDGTELGDRVHLRPIGVDVAVISRRIRLGVGAVVETRGRRIYRGGDALWTP